MSKEWDSLVLHLSGLTPSLIKTGKSFQAYIEAEKQLLFTLSP